MASHGGQAKPPSSASPEQQQQQQPPASEDAPPPLPPFEAAKGFLGQLGCATDLPEAVTKGHFLPALIRSTLKVEAVERGRVALSFTVVPHVANYYNTLHGGAVAAVADVVAHACLRTVAGGGEFFLGESAVSYLSAARLHAELDIEGRIVRKGRNVIVASVEFKIKETQRLAHIARFTFYNMLFAKL